MHSTPKAALAEFIGTFTLIFIGAGAGVVSKFGPFDVAFAHGIALLVIIYTWGSISGAHVNPAVTLGVLITGRMPIAKAVIYWIVQFAGAALAAYTLKYLLGDKAATLGATVGDLTDPFPIKAVILEAILTFFLVAAVFSSGIGGLNGNAAGIAIGLVLTMDIIVGGTLTGASMNPARTFGPWLANGDFKGYLWIYMAGPFAGGAVAALLYNTLFLPQRQQPLVEAAR